MARVATPPRSRSVLRAPVARAPKASARLEFRADDAADTWLSTLAYTQQMSRDWSLLGRNLYNRTEYDDVMLGS